MLFVWNEMTLTVFEIMHRENKITAIYTGPYENVKYVQDVSDNQVTKFETKRETRKKTRLNYQ